MSTLRPFNIKPGSPDQAIKAGTYAESSLARIAHINRFSRDANDIKFYETNMEGNNSATIKITSKKGIVELVNPDTGSDELYIYLQNSDITTDRESFYLQLTAYTTGNCIPVIMGAGYSADQLLVRISDARQSGNPDWSILYFYYELIRID